MIDLKLQMTTEDGTVLTADTDEELARQWAAHDWGDAWAEMSLGRRAVEMAAALRDIRRAHKG